MKEQLAVMQCGSSQNQQDRNSLTGVSVTALRGKVSCSWAKEYHKDKMHSSSHTRDLLGKPYEGSCLCLGAAGSQGAGSSIMAFRVFWGWELVLRVHLCTLKGCLCKGRTLYSAVVYIFLLLQM